MFVVRVRCARGFLVLHAYSCMQKATPIKQLLIDRWIDSVGVYAKILAQHAFAEPNAIVVQLTHSLQRYLSTIPFAQLRAASSVKAPRIWVLQAETTPSLLPTRVVPPC